MGWRWRQAPTTGQYPGVELVQEQAETVGHLLDALGYSICLRPVHVALVVLAPDTELECVESVVNATTLPTDVHVDKVVTQFEKELTKVRVWYRCATRLEELSAVLQTLLTIHLYRLHTFHRIQHTGRYEHVTDAR